MKKTILKFLVITLFVQAQGLSAFAQQAESTVPKLLQSPNEEATAVQEFPLNQSVDGKFSPSDLLDMDSLEKLVNSGKLTVEQYDDLIDLLESGGDTMRVQPEADRILTPDEEALVNDATIKDIGALTSIGELQKYSEKQVAGYGQWGFHFLYIGNDGTRKELSSLKKNTKIRPASTMKLFSSNLAFDKKTYSLANLGTLLQKSKNGMADAALRSVAKSIPDYRVSKTDPRVAYLLTPGLEGYKMYDSTEHKSQVVDNLILRGSSLMINEYANLEDSSKFHPVNGSGLQQSNKDTDLQRNTVTPRLETALLEKIYKNKVKYAKYKNLLTSPGKPGGTLYNTFKNGRKLAKIYAKTGTLGNGKGLAGFAETKKGVIVFSILSDDLRGIGVKEALKVVIENVVYSHLSYVNAQEAKK